MTHTQTHTHTHTRTTGRTPLNQLSARLRGRYLQRTHSLEMNIHTLRGIRTRDPSNRAAAKLHLRQHGLWDRHKKNFGTIITDITYSYKKRNVCLQITYLV
jgi:hypothetical protein